MPGEASGQHLEVPEASGILVHRKFPLVAVPVRFISHIMWTGINHSNYFLYFTELIRDYC